MQIDLDVKYPLLLSDFNETGNFSTDFRKKKFSNTEFHENPSITMDWEQSSMRTDRQGGGWTDGQTNRTKLVVAL
jgi:hypothetical protein